MGFPDAGVNQVAFREAFFHGVAPWLLQRREWDCLHGSAVLTWGEVMAFCGPAHRGKSTLARAWVDRGAIPYADDAAPFLVQDGVARSARLPQRISLREPAASYFPNVPAPEYDLLPGGEIWYDLEPTLRPLRSVYWLEPMTQAAESAVTVLARIPPVEALPLLLSAAHCMSWKDPGCNRKMVLNYLSLVRLTPVFRLSFVSDLHRLPTVIDRLERHQEQLPGGRES
ncbi:MAG: hypothetical protein HY238_18150 [Acidobacteria bacterium]|nr:hypothetical protein [Acidobacteriota bacterium]